MHIKPAPGSYTNQYYGINRTSPGVYQICYNEAIIGMLYKHKVQINNSQRAHKSTLSIQMFFQKNPSNQSFIINRDILRAFLNNIFVA